MSKEERVEKVKEGEIEIQGVVVDTQRGKFKVEIFPEGKPQADTDKKIFVTATIAGKLRQFNIRVVVGDKVKVNVSPYDLTKGRITYRLKE